MIRLLKFRARFRYEIVSDTKIALLKCLPEIIKSSPARVLEEIFKMLESGSSAPFFQLMSDSGLLKLLFKELAEGFSNPDHRHFAYLMAVDRINQKNMKRPLSRGILAASLLFPLIDTLLKNKVSKGEIPHLGQIHSICYDVIQDYFINSFTHFPRRVLAEAAMMITHQYRMTPLQGKRHFSQRFLRSRDFSDALLFFRIRAEADPELIFAFEEWREHFLKIKKETGHAHHD